MTKRIYALGLLAVLAAFALAACGGGSGYSGNKSSETQSGSTEGSAGGSGAAALTGGSVSGLGTVLVDSEGMTLYMFAKDKGTASSCYGECETAWPPLRTKGAPSAGEGAMSSLLGTTKRKDGTMQVTYAGHPLYTFFEDKSPGEATGNGSTAFGGAWWALNEAGEMVEGGAAEPEETESSAGSGGRYGY